MKKKIEKTKPSHSRTDLKLSEYKLNKLKNIASDIKSFARFRLNKIHKQTGHITLFTGADGTGKTLAAEVIANELKVDLYRIDLSRVVSKYIGETEKNLARIFKRAENKDWILFFDEADALFGKRTEVKDAHDRYANIEINYLLQRIETYPGIVILATNKKASLDAAFVRRLRFIINFPPPKRKKRTSIRRN